MARIRTIKPEFWTDEKVVILSALARLLFIGMWNFVDDEGRAEYSPLRMKMQILPADDADMSALLGEIRREALITVYDVDGKQYFQVNGFAKHQKVDKRSPSKLPSPPNSPEFPRIVPTEGKGKEGSIPDSFANAQLSAPVEQISEPQSQPAEKNEADDGMASDEDRFWARANEMKARGIARSQMGRLANTLNGAFDEGLMILNAAAKAREPATYLAKIINGLRSENAPPQPPDPKLPPWVTEARTYGYPVEREGKYWRFAGGLFDDGKQQVGN